MKKFKKFFAMFLTLTMVAAMSLTAFAAKPTDKDKGTVKITGLEGNPTVTLYKVVEAEYGANGLTGWKTLSNEVKLVAGKDWQPTSAEITAIANDVNKKEALKVDEQKVTGSTYTCADLPAGAYIAILTGAADGIVYNPIILSVSYNENSTINTNDVNVENGYAYGLTAVAKKTDAGIKKDITGGTTPDDTNNNVPTASIGDAVEYTLTPTMPSYPANALNKTVYVTDEMVTGLRFLPHSLNISFKEDSSVAITPTVDATAKTITFTKADGTVIGTATYTDQGFKLPFIYNNLANGTQGAVYTPVITYKAVITNDAVVGSAGNDNTVHLYYANKPNEGSSYDEPGPDEPTPENPDYRHESDKEIVYTYELTVRKVDADDNTVLLENAVFGIYTDEACTNLVDKVKTNDKGIAVSTKVEAGTYYVKELAAPAGYSISEDPIAVKVDWTTATSTTTEATHATRFEATTKDAGDQVGWLDADGNFYRSPAADEYATANGWTPARIVTDDTVVSDTITVTNGDTAGAGAAFRQITNTKMSGLPSTGGIGTTIFTIGGCIIMIAAAGFFFASRRKSAAK